MGQSHDWGAIDPTVLERLAEELGSLGVAQRIGRIYLELLEERVSRLCTACEAGDVDAALETALTLKVTSATVGAVAVSGCAERVERGLRNGGLRGEGGSRGVKRLEALRRAATDTLVTGFGLGRPTGRGR